MLGRARISTVVKNGEDLQRILIAGPKSSSLVGDDLLVEFGTTQLTKSVSTRDGFPSCL